MEKLTCFKAYDIRGQLGTQLDESIGGYNGYFCGTPSVAILLIFKYML